MRFPHATFYSKAMAHNIMLSLEPLRVETLGSLRRIEPPALYVNEAQAKVIRKSFPHVRIVVTEKI